MQNVLTEGPTKIFIDKFGNRKTDFVIKCDQHAFVIIWLRILAVHYKLNTNEYRFQKN